METLQERLNSVFERSGMTQTELAEKIGMNLQQLNHYLKGRQKPKFETVKKIAAALGVHPMWLFHGIDESEADQAQRLQEAGFTVLPYAPPPPDRIFTLESLGQRGEDQMPFYIKTEEELYKFDPQEPATNGCVAVVETRDGENYLGRVALDKSHVVVMPMESGAEPIKLPLRQVKITRAVEKTTPL